GADPERDAGCDGGNREPPDPGPELERLRPELDVDRVVGVHVRRALRGRARGGLSSWYGCDRDVLDDVDLRSRTPLSTRSRQARATGRGVESSFEVSFGRRRVGHRPTTAEGEP